MRGCKERANRAMINPVFVNELRQSPLRRRALVAFNIWGIITAALVWIAHYFSGYVATMLSWIPLFVLPIIVPSFAAGAFAKEYEQHTWQDLYLTRLTNLQVVTGKFFAALLQVGLVIFSFLPAVIIMIGRDRPWTLLVWWTLVIGYRLLISSGLYVLIAMVCSRYSSNRRVALIWSYIALFLYAMLGAGVWSLVGAEEARANAADNMNGQPLPDPIAPGFMQGIHLIFCAVVGVGFAFLLWVSMSEQRGYKGSTETSNRSWEPIARTSTTKASS